LYIFSLSLPDALPSSCHIPYHTRREGQGLLACRSALPLLRMWPQVSIDSDIPSRDLVPLPALPTILSLVDMCNHSRLQPVRTKKDRKSTRLNSSHAKI